MNTRNIGNEAKINPKTGRIDQACERYGVGRSTMRRIAEESGAVVRVGRTYLINYSTEVPAQIRVNAANAALSQCSQWTKNVDMIERLEAMEELMSRVEQEQKSQKRGK